MPMPEATDSYATNRNKEGPKMTTTNIPRDMPPPQHHAHNHLAASSLDQA